MADVLLSTDDDLVRLGKERAGNLRVRVENPLKWVGRSGDMSTEPMSLDQIRRMGLEALAERLGPDSMIRFLQQFETGSGDYTNERHQWLQGAEVREVAREIAGAGKSGEVR
jgi:hypothetical protein